MGAGHTWWGWLGVGDPGPGRGRAPGCSRPLPPPRSPAGLRVEVLQRRTCSKNREEQETARIGPGRCEGQLGGGGNVGKTRRLQMLPATPSSILVPAETWAWIGRENGGLGAREAGSARTGGFLEGVGGLPGGKRKICKAFDHQDWEA